MTYGGKKAMRTKVKRLILIAMLCFSCIFLFRSGNAKAQDNETWDPNAWEDLNGGCVDENRECACRRDGMALQFYLGGRSYVTVDVALVAALMVLVFLLVLERM